MMTLEQKMHKFRELKLELDNLEAEIKAEVEDKKTTIKLDGIQAVYGQGRKSYKYESAGKEYADQEVIDKHTKPKTDWKAVCKDAGLVNIPFTQGAPSVSIKIKDTEATPFPV